jgi:hypothetical protein
LLLDRSIAIISRLRKAALLRLKTPTKKVGSVRVFRIAFEFSSLSPPPLLTLFSSLSHQTQSHLQAIMSASARLSAVTKQLGSAASSPQGLLAGEVSIVTGVRSPIPSLYFQ